MRESELVTVAVFDMPGVVKIYQDALEQEGIKSFVPNDYPPFDSHFCYILDAIDRGINLQVEKQDAKIAIEILNEDPECRKYIVYNDNRDKELELFVIFEQAIRNWLILIILFIAYYVGSYVLVVIVAAAIFGVKEKMRRK